MCKCRCNCFTTLCCFENKRTSRRCVCFWSFLTLAAGVAVLFYAILFTNAEVIDKVEDNIQYMDENQVQTYLQVLLFTIGTLVSLAGCFGLLFKWMRNRCCTVMFGMCLLPLWIITLAIGASSIYISYRVEDEFTEECDKFKDDSNKFGEFQHKEIIFALENDNLDISFNLYREVGIDANMCSKNCPCPAELPTQGIWDSISGRTLDWQFGPLPGSEFVVYSYEQCIVLIEQNENAEPAFQEFAKGWKASLGYADEVAYLKFFEQEYEYCSSICQTPLFGFSLPVQLGQPKSCFEDIKEEVKDRTWWLGVSASGAGILLLNLWLFQYCLWRLY